MPETDWSESTFDLAAVILCGGKSSRMGFDKFRLPLGGRTFLENVACKLIETVAGPVVIAASSETEAEVKRIVAALDNDRLKVVIDQRADCGPLEGIRVGIEEAAKSSRWAFVTSCDVPLICPEVLEVLQASLQGIESHEIEAAIPATVDRIYGMTAIYRCSALPKIQAMVERRQLRVSDLATELITRRIDVAEIRKADPELDSMANLNSPGEYLDFLRRRGFDCPPEIEQQLN